MGAFVVVCQESGIVPNLLIKFTWNIELLCLNYIYDQAYCIISAGFHIKICGTGLS